VWEAVKGLPNDVHVKRVSSVEEKVSVESLLSSGEVDHKKSSFLYNKVASCV